MAHLIVIAACSLLAGPDPAALLLRADAASNRAKDATITLTVSVSERGSDPLERTMRVWQLGAERRMVKFLEPARLRGTGILVPERGQTYLYLPAYQRVRRIVGKEGGQSFMGTGFAINDLARVRFSGDYTATIASEDAALWHLQLTPVRPEEHRHASLKIDIRKADDLVSRVTSLDAAGTVLRTIDMTDFKAAGAYTIAHRIEIDEADTGKKTVAVVKEAAFDSGLDAAFFSERELRRAP